MDSINVQIVSLLITGAVGLAGAATPIVSLIVNAVAENKNKRLDIYLEHRHSIYREFASSYAALSISATRKEYMAFVSAAHNAMLISNDDTCEKIRDMLVQLKASGGVTNNSTDSFYNECLSALRDESVEFRNASSQGRKHRFTNTDKNDP